MAKDKRSSFFKDFKAFINKGNVIGLAVAVIIGAAFGKIVSSLVDQIIMPLVSLLLGGKSFADLKWVIKEAVYDADKVLIQSETALGYGMFIQAVVDFLIIAFFVFLIVRIASNTQSKLEKLRDKNKVDDVVPVAPPKPTQEELLAEIRDLLKNQKAQK